jgi:antitoxin CptB
MISNEEFNRMRWAARRGMLELDLVLEPFVTARYAQLSVSERQCLQALMTCEDQDLYAWLMQREEPPEAEQRALVRKILDFAHTPPADR